ncbi:hypothetical protein [Methanospirillum sp.]|uniref:hypothetical protein n=1 Tax=Methanospirillum sp. TaxID=45200 RepID=UPI00359FAA79
MAILEIDQIKRSEKDAADLIEASQRRKTLVIEEARREGDELVLVRLSEADNRLRDERKLAEKHIAEEHSRLMDDANKEADKIRQGAEKQKSAAIHSLVRLITGE